MPGMADKLAVGRRVLRSGSMKEVITLDDSSDDDDITSVQPRKRAAASAAHEKKNVKRVQSKSKQRDEPEEEPQRQPKYRRLVAEVEITRRVVRKMTEAVNPGPPPAKGVGADVIDLDAFDWEAASLPNQPGDGPLVLGGSQDWRDEVEYVGGGQQAQLQQPAAGPSHAGTMDVDVEALLAPPRVRSPERHDPPATLETTIDSVLSVLPDMCPDHARDFISKLEVFNLDLTTSKATEMILEQVFEGGVYPKANPGASGSGSGGQAAAGSSKSRFKEFGGELDSHAMAVDGVIKYQSIFDGLDVRKGEYYVNSGHTLLCNLFPELRIQDISLARIQYHNLLVPTFIHLFFDRQLPENKRLYPAMKLSREAKPAYKPSPRKGSGSSKNKGKGRQVSRTASVEVPSAAIPEGKGWEGKAAFETERQWLEDWLRVQDGPEALAVLRIMAPPRRCPDTECQCCFGDEHIEYMVPCQEGHLFCPDCILRLIEGSVGEHKHISCVDGSGCKAQFAYRDLKKTAGERLFNAYQNVMLRLDLEAAGIEGLESCPRCEYAAVLDDPEEKLFRCQKEECMFVSCRKCHRVDHIPKSCEEAAKDAKLDLRHTVEEAMSDALIRKCPNATCQKPFLKESGCNKMYCTYCRQTSCYICRKIITDGYNHFDQNPVDYAQAKKQGRCRLWDPTGHDAYAEEVAKAKAAAEKEALAAAARAGAEVAVEDIAVAAPEQRFLHGRAAAPGADIGAGGRVAAAPAALPMPAMANFRYPFHFDQAPGLNPAARQVPAAVGAALPPQPPLPPHPRRPFPPLPALFPFGAGLEAFARPPLPAPAQLNPRPGNLVPLLDYVWMAAGRRGERQEQGQANFGYYPPMGPDLDGLLPQLRRRGVGAGHGPAVPPAAVLPRVVAPLPVRDRRGEAHRPGV